MALLKAVDTESGAVASYWRIVRMEYDLLARTAFYILAGYVSEQARADGKVPLRTMALTYALAPGMDPDTVTRAVLYQHARSWAPGQGEPAVFDGAVDA